MCDTLCVVGNGRALFAKNSDRPYDEPQVVEAFPPRVARAEIGSVLDPVEARLWSAAVDVAADRGTGPGFAALAWREGDQGLDRLA